MYVSILYTLFIYPLPLLCFYIFFLLSPPPPRSTLFPYTTLFRSAHARLLDHRAHGIHAARAAFRRGRRQPAERRRRVQHGAVLRRRLRADDARGLRRAPVPVAQGLRVREPRRLARPQPAQPLVRLRDDGSDVLAGRAAADRRVLRQARRALVGGAGGAALARGGRRDPVPGGRLLLPAHRQADAFRRAEGSRTPSGTKRDARAALPQRPSIACYGGHAPEADAALLHRHQLPLN